MAQLIFQTAFIGDALLSIPLIKNLKEFYPEEKIEIVCRPLVADLYNRLNLVKAHPVDKSQKRSWRELKEKLSSQSYTRVYCPHESFRSAAFVSQIKAETKVGYKSWWNFPFFDYRLARPMFFPEALRQLFLLTPFNKEIRMKLDELSKTEELNNSDSQRLYNAQTQAVPEWANMEVSLDKSIVESKKAEYGLPDHFVSMAPGSVWATKRWDKEKYREVCEGLVANGESVVVAGSPAENELCAEIIKGIPNTYNLAGNTDLYDMIHVLKSSRLLVSNDSGTMHLAAAAGTPTVSVFGPTTLKLGYRPWQSKAYVVQNPLACRPCGLHGHKSCPIGTHECMKKLSSEQVYDLVKL